MKRRIATFYVILATQTISLVGSRMTAVGVGIYVYRQTGLATPLLLSAFFNELPGMLAGSLAGVWVDRWDRRRVMMLGDFGQAVGTALLLASFLSGQFQIWHLYLVALLQGSFAIFQEAAKTASTTLLVPESQRERLNGIQEMSFPLAGTVAPVLAGLVYAAAGVQGVLLADLTTFLVAVAAIYGVRIPKPAASAEGLAGRGSFLKEWQAGIGFLRRRKPLFGLLLYGIFINFMLNGPLDLATPYLLNLTGSEVILGQILGVMSLGAFSGALLIAVWGGTRPRIHTLMPALLFNGAMMIVFGVARLPLVLAVSAFLMLLPLPLMNALWISILQVKTPSDLQGRIFAFSQQLGYLGSTLSFVLTGPLVDQVLKPAVGRPAWSLFAPLVGSGPGAAIGLLLTATGLAILAVTAAVYALPAIRNLERDLPGYEGVTGD